MTKFSVEIEFLAQAIRCLCDEDVVGACEALAPVRASLQSYSGACRRHENPDFDADWNPTPERLARDLADSAA